MTGRSVITLSNQTITGASGHGKADAGYAAPCTTAVRATAWSGQIQLWNHIRWNQEEYGMTWAASTGYR